MDLDADEQKKEGWPPEDEYDALNDETFGGDGEEYNWDDANALFKDVGKVKPNGQSSHGHKSHKREVLESNNLLDYQQLDTSFDRETSKQEFEDDFDNENALEESISRLVMDDFDDEEEEEARKSKLRRLGTSNFNTYFMPPQVASKHLQWLMDKEEQGGNTLLGSSVWSMHPTTTLPEPTPTHQHTFSASQLHSDSINSEIRHLTGSMKPKGDASTEKLSDGVIQDRIAINLNNLIGPASSSRTSLSSISKHKPVFKTVEEIEKELLEGDSIPDAPKSVEVVKVKNNRPRVITAEELERELTSSPPRQLNEIPLVQSPIAQSAHHISSPITPKSQQAVPLSMTPPFQQPFGSPAGRMQSPPGMNVRMMMQQMTHPNMVPGPTAFAQRMISSTGLPHPPFPPSIAQLAYHQQQQHIRILQMNPHFRGRLPFIMPFPQMGLPMRHGYPIQPGHHGLASSSPGGPGYKRPSKTDDPYRGLMNEKDKQRLRNIQIIQLQNDHPYTTDYYCLMYKVRHGVSDPKRQQDCLFKLFPKKSDENSNRNNYQPAHFENSLGKLQAVSALAPKKAIDTVIRVVDSGPTNRSGMKAYRYLLLEVEKLYECLLKIQEADIRKTLLYNADQSVTEFRNASTKKVIKVLQSPEKLSEILSVKKGKMLISRLIPLMEPSVRYSVFAHMIRNFQSWATTNNSEIEKTYPFLRHCIIAAEMPDLLSLMSSDFKPNVYEQMVSSKLGLSLLMAAFHRAEGIICKSSETSPLQTDELIRNWVCNARFAVLSIIIKDDDLAIPIEISPNILHHLGRFGLHAREMIVLENKIRGWTSNAVPLIL